MLWTAQFSSATADASSPRFLNVSSIPNINIVAQRHFRPTHRPPLLLFLGVLHVPSRPANQPH